MPNTDGYTLRWRSYQIAWVITVCLLYGSCLSPEQKDEKIARQYCSNCHTFPEASLLPKAIWKTSVMPQMAFRMGRDLSTLNTLSSADRTEVMTILPPQSMVTEEEWQSIQRYYEKNAPDSLTFPQDKKQIALTLPGFQAEAIRVGSFPLHTFLDFDAGDHRIFLGSRLNKLYALNDQFQVQDSTTLTSPPSMLFREPDGSLTILLMGIMDPNDQAAGKLARMDGKTKAITTLIDSLKRPVHMARADLDRDGKEDYVICAFGNFTGNLLAFRNKGNGTYERRTLVNLPGARKTIIRDFDGNGLPDIMALMSQGDERIILLLNQGRFDFRVTTLLTFPPLYGSSYFDLKDFNGDGNLDILYTNGDNADYSMTLKPYHGVHVFLNTGNNEFKEWWFYNMHGASEAVAEDFDNDGDIDIAAVSFFPRFEAHAEEGFIYFKNTGTDYEPFATPLAKDGRWLRINADDVDRDGDKDILLTALDFNNGIPTDLLTTWKEKPVSVLLLRNTATMK